MTLVLVPVPTRALMVLVLPVPTQALPLLVVLGERQNEIAAALVLVPVPTRALMVLVPLQHPVVDGGQARVLL